MAPLQNDELKKRREIRGFTGARYCNDRGAIWHGHFRYQSSTLMVASDWQGVTSYQCSVVRSRWNRCRVTDNSLKVGRTNPKEKNVTGYIYREALKSCRPTFFNTPCIWNRLR